MLIPSRLLACLRTSCSTVPILTCSSLGAPPVLRAAVSFPITHLYRGLYLLYATVPTGYDPLPEHLYHCASPAGWVCYSNDSRRALRGNRQGPPSSQHHQEGGGQSSRWKEYQAAKDALKVAEQNWDELNR